MAATYILPVGSVSTTIALCRQVTVYAGGDAPKSGAQSRRNGMPATADVSAGSALKLMCGGGSSASDVICNIP
jgi:hypothetical protein